MMHSLTQRRRVDLNQVRHGRFIECAVRAPLILLPEAIDDYVCEENPIRVFGAFVDAIDLPVLGFDAVIPEETGRPSYVLRLQKELPPFRRGKEN